MTDLLRNRVKEVLADALERETRDRRQFVKQACGDDQALLARVLELLIQERDARQAFDAPSATLLSHDEISDDGLIGETIGRYEILREIGAGGMGTVYEAVQDHPHRLVAVKVLRRGSASRQAIGRFRHEAEILGRLRHPGIAQVYDLGTLDRGAGAQPYFAMELITGRPLIAEADTRALDRRERLALFVKICDAVQYAHQMGVIHRDLKPDNILVDEHGDPRILDFGIARVTDADLKATTVRTDVGQLIGTIPYMSPEQVTGDPAELDTRSDVYSLGVVLYELMCGRLPHDLADKSVPEAARVILEDEPTPLSSIDRVLRGDVETIALKALEKDKTRRYQTAAELAADVRRHLEDEPIVARPASTFYQLRKFARRNRALVGGVVAVFVVMAAGVTVSTLLAVGQTRAKDEAILEARKATEISEYFMWVLSLINPNEEGGTSPTPAQLHYRATTLHGLLDLAGDQIESALPDWPLKRAELHVRFGHTYFGLLNRSKATFHFQRAYDLRAEHLGEGHPVTYASLCLLGRNQRGRWRDADELLQEAYDGLLRVAGPDDADTIEAKMQLGYHLGFWRWQFDKGEQMLRETLAKRELGDDVPATITNARKLVEVLIRAQRLQAAEELALEFLDLSRAKLGEEHFRTLDLLTALGTIQRRTRRYSDAERNLREAYDILISRMGIPATRTSVAASRLGQTLNALGRPDDAERLLQDLVKATRAEVGDNNIATWLAHYRLGYVMRNRRDRLGDVAQIMTEAVENCSRIQGEESWLTLTMSHQIGSVLRRDRQFEEAHERLQWTLQQQREVHGPDAMEVLFTLEELAHLASDQKDFVEAERLYREGLEGLDRIVGENHPSWLRAASRFGYFLKDRGPGKVQDAVELLNATSEKLGNVLGKTHSTTLWCMHALADALSIAGDFAAAEDQYRLVLGLRRESLAAEHPDIRSTINTLAWFLKDRGLDKAFRAREFIEEAIDLYTAAHGPEHPETLNVMDTLGMILRKLENPGEATSHFRELAATVERVLPREHWLAPIIWGHYGLCLFEQELFEAAEPWLSDAYPRLKTARGDDDEGTRAVREALVTVYERLDDPDKANSYRRPVRPEQPGEPAPVEHAGKDNL